ncbi:MAG: DUF58 domain-containing protein [Candidatus Acidiferrales bacterium]
MPAPFQDSPLVPEAAVALAKSRKRLPFGFGPRFFVGLLLGLAWLVPAWRFREFLFAMLLWDVLLLGAWLWDLLRLPAPRQIEVSRIWDARPSLGARSRVRISIRNSGRVAIRASIVDETPLSLRSTPAEVEIVARPAASGAALAPTAEASYPILPGQRGDARLGRTFVRYQSGLRLAERWAVAETSQVVRVLPNLEEARRNVLYLIRSRQVEMEKRRKRLRGIGREFETLREYREGDEARDICWTATARRNHLVTRLFQMERSQTVWLVLDAGRLLRSQVIDPAQPLRYSKLDYAVNAALCIAHVAMHCGDRVGLLAYGRGIQKNVAAARGPQHIHSMVEALAQVHAESSEPDHARAARSLLTKQKRRSLIIWITDFAETATTPEVIDYALQMTPRHLVVFAAMAQPDLKALAAAIPDSKTDLFRHAAALEICQRRDLLLRSLRQRGVLALELMPGAMAASLVNQYLDIKDRSLL